VTIVGVKHTFPENRNGSVSTNIDCSFHSIRSQIGNSSGDGSTAIHRALHGLAAFGELGTACREAKNEEEYKNAPRD